MTRPDLRDWPLAVFTLTQQFSCGLALAGIAGDWQGAPPAQLRSLGIAVFPTLAGGILVSLLHLGRPQGSWISLTNVARSRLSQEILLTALFALAALLHGVSWFAGLAEWRHATGTAAALV